MAKRISNHPGRLLKLELGVRSLSANQLAHYFGNDAQFWMNLQTQYDLAIAERDRGKRIRSEVERAA